MAALTPTGAPEPAEEALRHRRLPPVWSAVLVLFTAAALFLAVNQLFNLQLFVGVVFLDNRYLYLLIGALLPLVFLVFPATASAPQDRVPWYDVLLFLATVLVAGYFAWNSRRILDEGWEFAAPTAAVAMGFALWVLLLEAVRRAGGLALFVIIGVLSLYPTYAEMVPGPIAGFPMRLPDVAAYHATSVESVLGIPMRAFGGLVIGFVVFGSALQFTGAGRFFIDIAFALLGHVRGGPAKVAIFSSGLMGSMSGSVITNVLTTGVMSIPAMRRTGFSAPYAAGVEACASTGGVLMPPVMGATAFVMASFLGVPYVTIIAAAVIPSLLYYFGLFMQIDAYAARRGLAGLPRAELPRVGAALREGWFYLFAFALLLWMIVHLQRESVAPFFATAALLVINQLSPRNRLSLAGFLEFVAATGRLLAELVAVLAGVGLIVGALVATGMAGTLANDLVHLAGGAPFVLLIMGAITSFILGMGMTVTAAYVFLAIVLAPALTRVGLDPLAVHLFILYWGMLSFITPPVALGSFAAATLAGCSPMRAGFESMRLGAIIYFIPFFFVLNPALILHGSPAEVVEVLATAVLGVVLLSAALQRYLIFFGALGTGVLGWLGRILLFVGGLLFVLPGSPELGISHLELAGIALLTSALGVLLAALGRRAAGMSPAR
ncbi:MAG TPA: TRAP transporter fused permease subunit [Geminicoccaceae bacterium]|nr:TRAP transporter fused permease subunit [Geminicoccaceae bacterium]